MERIFDSELKVLEVLWEFGESTASEIARVLNQKCDWSRTTTYTVIKKCIQKGLVARENEKFICRALITQEQIRKQEATLLINRVFDGSPHLLIANLIDSGQVTQEQLDELRQFILEVEK